MKNIFEIWKENGEKLPFKARKISWCDKHHVLVEKIEIKKWPYGKVHGQYFFYGKPGEKGAISSAGTYSWKLV